MPRLTEKMPPYPTRRADVLRAAMRQLETGEWARLEGAPETKKALREFHGGGEIWFVSSGTAALEAILLGHEIGFGDEVITTPYTWGATVSSILAIGAIPIFADIDPQTGLIDPATVERCITPRTRAILAVHLFGQPADMFALRKIAVARGIFLFEDGSQAHGARLRGERVGRFGDAAAFSCMGMKPLAGTEGGYAIFEKNSAAEKAYLHGKHPRGLSAEMREKLAGENLLDALQLGWRPCAVSAELVRAALPFLNEENAARRANAARLRANLADVRGVTMPPEPKDTEGCHHLLSLLYDSAITGISRAEFVRRLNECGAGAFIYIPTPIHRLKRMNIATYDGPRVFWHEQLKQAGIDYRDTHCPQAEWRSEHSLEFSFNWTSGNPAAMDQLAEVIAFCARPEFSAR